MSKSSRQKKSPYEQLVALADEHAKRHGGTEEQAFAAVLKTSEGRALYAQFDEERRNPALYEALAARTGSVDREAFTRGWQEAKAYALRIMNLCNAAGRPELAMGMINRRTPIARVMESLDMQRAADAGIAEVFAEQPKEP